MAEPTDQVPTEAVERPQMDVDKPVPIAATSGEPVDSNPSGLQPSTPGSAAKKSKIQKNSKGVLELRIPHARVKRIMKLDKEVKLVSNDAAHLACKATELFLEYLGTETGKRTQQADRKAIQYKDLAAVVHDVDPFEFLTDLFPISGPVEGSTEKRPVATSDKQKQSGNPTPAPSSQRTLGFAPVVSASAAPSNT